MTAFGIVAFFCLLHSLLIKDDSKTVQLHAFLLSKEFGIFLQRVEPKTVARNNCCAIWPR